MSNVARGLAIGMGWLLTSACSGNLELAVPDAAFGSRDFGDRVAFAVSELQQAETDLNGDGDQTDLVLHVFDVATSTTVNLGVALRPSRPLGFTPGRPTPQLDVLVAEPRQGVDLNADGDLSDLVVHLLGPDDVLRNTGLAANPVSLDAVEWLGDVAVVVVSEPSQGRAAWCGTSPSPPRPPPRSTATASPSRCSSCFRESI